MLFGITQNNRERFFWSLVNPEKLCFRTWQDDDISVVYDAFSGNTHLIDSLGLALLQLLVAAPLSTEMLALKLADLYSEDDKAVLDEYIAATLLQLQDAGLLDQTSL